MLQRTRHAIAVACLLIAGVHTCRAQQPANPAPAPLTWDDLNSRTQSILKLRARNFFKLPDGRLIDGWGYNAYVAEAKKAIHDVDIVEKRRGAGFVTSKTVGKEWKIRRGPKSSAWGIYLGTEDFDQGKFELVPYWHLESQADRATSLARNIPPLWDSVVPGPSAFIIDPKARDQHTREHGNLDITVVPSAKEGTFEAKAVPRLYSRFLRGWARSGSANPWLIECEPILVDKNGHFRKPTVLVHSGYQVTATKPKSRTKKVERHPPAPRFTVKKRVVSSPAINKMKKAGWKIQRITPILTAHARTDLTATGEDLMVGIAAGKVVLKNWRVTRKNDLSIWQVSTVELKRRPIPATPKATPTTSTAKQPADPATKPKAKPKATATHTLYTTDGRTLSGQLVSENDDEVVFLVIVGGLKQKMTIERHEIKRIVRIEK